MSTFQGHLKFGDSNDGTPISISYPPPPQKNTKNLWSHHRGSEASAKHWSIAHQKCMVCHDDAWPISGTLQKMVMFLYGFV